MLKDLFEIANNQLIVSAELLYLLQWLVENEQESLKEIIKKALKKNLKKEISNLKNTKNIEISPDLHNSIIDFVGLMEILLAEAIDEEKEKKTFHNKLKNTAEYIDSTICDEEIVQYSLEETSSQMEQNPNQNPKDILFKEILKNWEPTKKEKM